MTTHKSIDRVDEALERLYAAGVQAGRAIPEKTGLGMVIAGEILPAETRKALDAAYLEMVLAEIGGDEVVTFKGNTYRKGEKVQFDMEKDDAVEVVHAVKALKVAKDHKKPFNVLGDSIEKETL